MVCIRKKLGDGKSILFWKDGWLGEFIFQYQYLDLYELTIDKNITVSEVLSTYPIHITFRRQLVGRLYLHFSGNS